MLGFDPAPTLIAIQSHRPSRVWICCDVHQPAIVAVAHRIAEKASMLACGEVQFVATDWAGLGLTELGARRDPVRPLRVDANVWKGRPGSCPQSAAARGTVVVAYGARSNSTPD